MDVFLIVGGFGTGRKYFEGFMHRLKFSGLVTFYEFDVHRDHEAVLPAYIQELNELLPYPDYQLTIVPFSISCALVTKAVRGFENKIRLVLIDPPNIFPDIAFGPRPDAVTPNKLHKAYEPLALCKPLQKQTFYSFLIGGNNARNFFKVFELGGPLVQKTGASLLTWLEGGTCPYIVNEYIFGLRYRDMKAYLENYMFAYNPWDVLRSLTAGDRVLTGKKSPHLAFNSIGENASVVDGGHHLINS